MTKLKACLAAFVLAASAPAFAQPIVRIPFTSMPAPTQANPEPDARTPVQKATGYVSMTLTSLSIGYATHEEARAKLAEARAEVKELYGALSKLADTSDKKAALKEWRITWGAIFNYSSATRATPNTEREGIRANVALEHAFGE